MVSICSPLSPNLVANSISVEAPRSRGRLLTSREYGVLLQFCIDSKSLERGKMLHSRIRKDGFERNRDLLPRLIKLYSVCGRIDDAKKLFDRMSKRNSDVFLWTSMICAYAKNGSMMRCFELFVQMLERGVRPDSYTFSGLMKASAEFGFLELTLQLHSMVVRCGCGGCLSVANSLIHAYGSFGVVHEARKLFDRMVVRDVASWSAMIQVCSSMGSYADSMALFSRMQLGDSLKPNELTVVALLPACGFFSSLRKGQAVHAYVIRNGYESNLIVGSTLVTMYSRCGDPDVAYTIFTSFYQKNLVLWTSMIEGFALNGKYDIALNLFKKMQDQGFHPNYVTLVVILSACSHAGFIEEGLQIFETMQEKFGVKAGVEHYACVVDMLGRGGRLDDAEKFIENMGMRPSGSMLGSLLGACQVHRNVEIGERMAYRLFELEPHNAANYVILSNVYAAVGQWHNVGRVRQMMIAKGLLKDSGCSWIELKDTVYVFGAHDRSHWESDKIYKVLEELSEEIGRAGYLPATEHVLLDVEENEKKKLLCSHSERLAIAFGLLKVPPEMPIRIAKNLRVCDDCHEAIKLISRVTSRKFVVRDTNRFHHFYRGSCSCGDYW
ncbi:hypothetical protein C4D60_Mb01t13750 [Musa balbisiana]|uniref:DYW domain-containing protein n=1 Tax=Musa balbisiana TaxID=52838 RepID=A0A4S8JMC3_MUSBA|nr:hypothetical protein C4D60_Mb01t13750 [Musa balbisiana]